MNARPLLTALLLAMLCHHGHTAPVYECMRNDGSVEFSDLECENQTLLFYDRDEDATDRVKALINRDLIEQARAIATEHQLLGLFYLQLEKHQRSIDQQQKKPPSNNPPNEVSLKENQQTSNLQQNVTEQQQQIAKLKRQLKKAVAIIKKQNHELAFQRQRLTESFRPKYLPSIGQWCLQQGDQLNCSDEKPK